MDDLKPLAPAWVCPSLIFGEVALCRDAAGVLWFCRLVSEAEGWLAMKHANTDDIEAMRWAQRLACNPVQPWPEPSIPEPEPGRERP